MLTLPTLPTAQPATAHVVAFSGGRDSAVLLQLAVQQKLLGLCAVHVHHGLQAAADDWARHCESVCAALGVPLRVVPVQINPDDARGPESAARAARYEALRTCLPEGGVLMTAHHQADQAETLLMRLLRGTGVEGLAAMHSLTPFAPGWLWRPLLQTPHKAIVDYAMQHALPWVEDPHNSAPRYARSWLRQQAMPILRSRWPEVDRQFALAASHAQEADTLLQDLAARWLQSLLREDGGLGIQALAQHQPAEQRLILRHWLKKLGLPTPEQVHLQALQHSLLPARESTAPLVCWPGVECRRYRDGLYASAPLPVAPAHYCQAWDGNAPLQLPEGCGVLQMHEQAAPGPVRYCVRFTQGGEQLRPAGSRHRRRFKLLAQAAGLPPWVRLRMPMLEADGQLVSIAGLWNIENAPALDWQPSALPGLSWPPANL
jgi:tRNA(Ile)-lysidine synthase